jgi:hypothetical protein
LGEGTVHRSEIAAQLLGVPTGVRITPKLLARLLGHPSGGMKGIPPDAEAVVLLTQWNEPDGTDGGSIAEGLLRTGRVARVVQADLRVPDPVLALWYP